MTDQTTTGAEAAITTAWTESSLPRDETDTQSSAANNLNNHTSTAEHVLAVTMLALACFLGNGTVIHVYRKKGNTFGKFYYILLAVVDIFVCCTLLPLYPIIRLEVFQAYLNFVFSFVGIVTVTYAWILLTMTLERMLAIFRPFSIVTNRRKLHKIALGLYGFHIGSVVIATTLNLIGGGVYGYVVMLENFLFLLIALTVIVVSYPSMIYKLVFEARAMANYQVDNHVMQNQTQSQKKKKKQQQQQQPQHVQSHASPANQSVLRTLSPSSDPDDIIIDLDINTSSNITVRQSRTQTAKKGDVARGIHQQQQASISSRNRARNLTTVKVFSAVLILYLASFLPPILVALDIISNFYVSYMYFLNHVGNPFCYYVINAEFRSAVHELMKEARNNMYGLVRDLLS